MHTALELLPVRTETRGAVPDEAVDLAVERVRAVSRLGGERVQFAQVKLTLSSTKTGYHPAAAQASVRAHGRVIRARAREDTLREAIQHMSDRLRSQLERGKR